MIVSSSETLAASRLLATVATLGFRTAGPAKGSGRGVPGLDKDCQASHAPAMATMNVSLPDQMKSWVEAQTRDGRFGNASDYVRDLIRRDQARQQSIREIQSLIDEGVGSGPARPFDISSFIAEREPGAR